MSNIIDSIRLSGTTYQIQGEITVDPSFDSGSTNPVENRVITPAVTKRCEGEILSEYVGGYSGGTYVGGFSAATYEESASYVIRNTAYITRMYKDGIRMKFIDAEGVETEVFACSASTYYNTVYNPPSSYATITIDTVGKNIEITPLDNYKLSYVVFYAYYDGSLLTSITNKFSALAYQEYDKTAIQLIDELSVQKQDTLSAGTGISISGNVISATGGGGNPTVELTQAEYDALVTAGTVSADTYYIITDAQAGDLSQYWTSAQTQSAITQATSGKQDTLVSGTNIKTINNESLLGSGNIDIQGGGGKAVSGGTNISITTGETADTINCTLNTKNGTGEYSFIANGIIGGSMNSATGTYATAFGLSNNAYGRASFVFGGSSYGRGDYSFAGGNTSEANGGTSFAFGYMAQAKGDYSIAFGSYFPLANNTAEVAIGKANVSHTGSTDADKTLFSVGNGTNSSNRHNAFEIRQNGDIYITINGQDVKLQDILLQLSGTTS